MERLRRKKQKKQNKGMIKKSILKIIVISIIVGLNWTGLLAVGKTLAYFFDNENSNANTYQASTLDFSLTSSNLNKSIGLTEKLFLGSVLTNSGSLAFQYTVESEKISGSDDFCNALELEAELNWLEKHDDTLMSFDVLASTMLGSWSFEIKLPVTATNISHGETCEVDLVFKGWQTDVATYEDGGFSDEERIHLKFTSRMIVLNEFLPNPNGLVPDYGFDFGEDGDSKPQGEWVELYNNSDVNYDLAGWYIWDASGDNLNKISITNLNTQPATTIIPGRGWLVVYMNKEVFDNTGDTVKLFDSADTLIDSYTYIGDNDYCEIEPTPEDENATNTTGSCGGVPPNKSYARIPDGIGYWVDPIPTPGGPNILESEIIDQEEVIEEEPITEEEPTDEDESTTEITVTDATTTDATTTDATTTDATTTDATTTDATTTDATTTDATTTDATTTDATTTDEGISDEEDTESTEDQTTIEGTTETSGETSGETTEDVIEEVIEETGEETTDETIIEETATEVVEETVEESVSEPEAPVIEETPVDEAPVIESIENPLDTQADEAPAEAPAEAPVVNEQPAAVPDDSSSAPDGSAESVSDGGGETSVSSDGGSPAEGIGESSGDSGVDAGGESVSE